MNRRYCNRNHLQPTYTTTTTITITSPIQISFLGYQQCQRIPILIVLILVLVVKSSITSSLLHSGSGSSNSYRYSIGSTTSTTTAFGCRSDNYLEERSRRSSTMDMDTVGYEFIDPSIRSILTANPDENNNDIISSSISTTYLDDKDRHKDEIMINNGNGYKWKVIDPETLCFRWEALKSYVSSSLDEDDDDDDYDNKGTKSNNTNTFSNNHTKDDLAKGVDDDEHLSFPIKAMVTIASECEVALFYRDFSTSTTSRSKGVSLSSLPSPPLPKHICGLLSLVNSPSPKKYQSPTNTTSPHITIATLLALNLLETSIQNYTKHQHGHAPLLKDMIDKIKTPSPLAPLLRALLQPTGLNLRNLVWHGFVGDHLPRRWLALCIVIIRSIDVLPSPKISSFDKHHHHHSSMGASPSLQSPPPKVEDDGKDDLETIRSLQNHRPFLKILQHGKHILRSPSSSNLSALEHLLLSHHHPTTYNPLLPPTHRSLLHVALHDYATNYPVCFAAIAGPLIEHVLRLRWCEVNGREEDKVARPGDYYITLDGHGQRDKHDILLLPFLSTNNDDEDDNDDNSDDDAYSGASTITNGAIGKGEQQPPKKKTKTETKKTQKKSKLVKSIGGVTMALMTDLYASSSGGPNIRASIAHGFYNRFLVREMEHMADYSLRNNNSDCAAAAIGGAGDTPIMVYGEYDVDGCVHDLAYATVTGLHLLATSVNDEDIVDGSSLVPLLPPSPATANNKLPPIEDIRQSYRPLFSYTSSILRDIDTVIDALSSLHTTIITTKTQLDGNKHMGEAGSGGDAKQMELSTALATLHKSIPYLTTLQNQLMIKMRPATNLHPQQQQNPQTPPPPSTWTYKDVFHEHKCNIRLSNCSASQTLLQEVATAVNSVREELIRGMEDLMLYNDGNGVSTRRRKQVRRRVSTAQLTFDFYSFAAFVALIDVDRRLVGLSLFLGSDDDGDENIHNTAMDITDNDDLLDAKLLVQAVKRTRMVVSTFSTTTNMDRGFKALKEYIVGKSIKAIAKCCDTKK